MTNSEKLPALVLSGGGARGAYEAGVVRGVVETLGLSPADPSPFRIMVGTSVGAINVAYLASQAHRGDLAINQLWRLWRELDISSHLRVDMRGVATMLRAWQGRSRRGSLLKPTALEHIVQHAVSWDRLHQNVTQGHLAAVVVAALRIADARTTMFADVAPGHRFVPSNDPHRHAEFTRIEPDHVLASAAIPLVFPARHIGRAYYCDGGVRFNTPIAPAIRCGADRIMVVSLRHDMEGNTSSPVDPDQYPSATMLIGKLLNALLLDPVSYDLQILQRFNKLAQVLDQTLTPEERQRVTNVMVAARGLPYRRLHTLVFTPSEDIGVLAARHIAQHAKKWKLARSSRWLLDIVAESQAEADADLASYLLFDGEFAHRLLELGYRDALKRSTEIHDFFGELPAWSIRPAAIAEHSS